MKQVTKYFLVLLSALLSAQLKATHIVGGEIYYDNLGGNNYKITLKVYVDCGTSTVPLDNPAFITIFDANNVVVDTMYMPIIFEDFVAPSINNPCITALGNACVKEGIYERIINLQPKTGGYNIVYQRCCRNGTILNIVTPGNIGSTYTEHIPGPEVVAANSSPRFNKLPPIFLCNGLQIKFDHSATDPDGDVLVYSLCTPYEGLSPCCGIVPSNPACAPTGGCKNTPPPYTPVQFISPYSSAYPMSSNPAVNINPSTGFLNGVPDIDGQWVFSICVQEFRGATLIGTHYRDFQFNVMTCSVTVLAQFNDQSLPIVIGANAPKNQFCNGYTYYFNNSSINGNVFNWDFGDLTTLGDTSHLANPTYTYPDTGAYVISLIANPGKPCADTTKKTIYIYPAFDPTFTAPPPQCITNNSFSFTVAGLFAPTYTDFTWNFGASAVPVTSTLQSPNGVVFNSPGLFPVSVIVKQRICTKTLKDTIEVYPTTKADFSGDSVTLCDPATVTFSNSSIAGGTPYYLWQFSNGGSSTSMNPTHVFSPAGIYNVTLTVVSTAGCKDTSKYVVPGIVTVTPRPVAGFSATPVETSIYDPDITFTDVSSNALTYNYTFGDGGSSSDPSPVYSYSQPGDYPVVQIVTNQFGCKDTAVIEIHIRPEFAFWIPNSFTPANKDGKNDIFMPSVIGVEKYLFEIYDRWGECIFRTEDTMSGWDGSRGGKPCQTDVYVWMITFMNVVTKREEVHYGHVNLLK